MDGKKILENYYIKFKLKILVSNTTSYRNISTVNKLKI